MSFSIRPHRRFPICCPVAYHAGLSEGHGTVWNLSLNGWRMSGDLPLRVGQSVPLTVILSNQQSMFVAAAIVRWKRGEDYGLETLVTDQRTLDQLEHYITGLVHTETHAETLRQVRTPV
jgi:hypothetical protein